MYVTLRGFQEGFGIHNELNTKLKEMNRSQCSDEGDEGVLQTMVRDVTQDGAGPRERRELCVLEDHNRFSCVAVTEKTGLLRRSHQQETKNAKADGWGTEEEINGEESAMRRKDERQGFADWWSDWWSICGGEASSSWEVSAPICRGGLVALMEVGADGAGESPQKLQMTVPANLELFCSATCKKVALSARVGCATGNDSDGR